MLKFLKITLLVPTALEAEYLCKLCPMADVEICGVGMAEVARSLQRLFAERKPEAVLLCGIAGAYGKDVAIGEVVAVESEQIGGIPESFAKRYPLNFFPLSFLRQVTSNTVCRNGAPANGAQIENMEGAVFAAMCAEAGIEHFGEIRAISNRVGDDRSQWNIPLAVENLARTIKMLNLDTV